MAPTTLLAHRGMAQTYHREDLQNDTCTATRIYPPEHPYLENTIASMQAAFDAGADIVEFDIHPTTDGQFAVFHDWTIDCRTQGKGVTREQAMSYLKTLDIGYGYTADGGKTFPFRGKGFGLMPTLDEVLATFPERRFLINIKSNYSSEGELLADRLLKLPPKHLNRLMAYGGDAPIARLRARIPKFRAMSRKTLTSCAVNYIAYGWSGAMPEDCRNTLLLVPSNTTFLIWGWPNLFLERMANAGTLVFVRGPITQQMRRIDASGINDLAAARGFPQDFPGGIWTDRIDRIASHFRPKPNSHVPD
ncbi:MAG: glycerophosphodiester phosphodiesterase [Alphaproteobacteria bacterium]|nr:glycerophosphodiester phosphodiesterase [Alphaproteobacteria bacterium]